MLQSPGCYQFKQVAACHVLTRSNRQVGRRISAIQTAEILRIAMNIFYTPKQVPSSENMVNSCSKSPIKPRLVVEKLLSGKHSNKITVHDFEPLTRKDFKIAHDKNYVDAFLTGGEGCRRNGLPWSEELAGSVK